MHTKVNYIAHHGYCETLCEAMSEPRTHNKSKVTIKVKSCFCSSCSFNIDVNVIQLQGMHEKEKGYVICSHPFYDKSKTFEY